MEKKKTFWVKKAPYNRAIGYHRRACCRSLEEIKRHLEDKFGAPKRPWERRLEKIQEEEEVRKEEDNRDNVESSFNEYLKEEQRKTLFKCRELKIFGERKTIVPRNEEENYFLQPQIPEITVTLPPEEQESKQDVETNSALEIEEEKRRFPANQQTSEFPKEEGEGKEGGLLRVEGRRIKCRITKWRRKTKADVSEERRKEKEDPPWQTFHQEVPPPFPELFREEFPNFLLLSERPPPATLGEYRPKISSSRGFNITSPSPSAGNSRHCSNILVGKVS